jgi:hypothetical protein
MLIALKRRYRDIPRTAGKRNYLRTGEGNWFFWAIAVRQEKKPQPFQMPSFLRLFGAGLR